MQYTVTTEWIATSAACFCPACDWIGTVNEVEEIGECHLTPGDPSPIGRCPFCSMLVYTVPITEED